VAFDQISLTFSLPTGKRVVETGSHVTTSTIKEAWSPPTYRGRERDVSPHGEILVRVTPGVDNLDSRQPSYPIEKPPMPALRKV
jgi:hypothetical protein